MGCHEYAESSMEGAPEWLEENGCDLAEAQEEIEGKIATYNEKVKLYNSARGTAPALSEITTTLAATDFVTVMETYSDIAGMSTTGAVDEAKAAVEILKETGPDPANADALEGYLRDIVGNYYGDLPADITELSGKMAELQTSFNEALEDDTENPDNSDEDAEGTGGDTETTKGDQDDEGAEGDKDDIDGEGMDPLEQAKLMADYPRMTFKEQCFLLSKIFPLVKYKTDVLNVATEAATGLSKKLPYYGDNSKFNAALGISGEPYAFLNRLVQHPGQAAFFNMPTSQLSNLQPQIRLFKVDMSTTDEVQQEFMFDSYASKKDVASLLDNKNKRGFGVGIKNFSFTYDGNNPFAAKKSIKAQLTIFASSFDELLVDRGGYMYADLALKTGKMTTVSDSTISAECQELKFAQEANLAQLKFRLKAVIGFAYPGGNTSSLFPLSTDTQKNEVLDAISESYVTLNLTPTVHEFKIDEMGRVNFTCNYLAYVEEFFDQAPFDIFFSEAEAIRTEERKYEYQRKTEDCDANSVGEWKKGLAQSGIVRQDKYKNMQSLMQRMTEAGLIRNLEIPFNQVMSAIVDGPFFEGWEDATADVGDAATEQDYKDALAISEATAEAAAETDNEIKEKIPMTTAENVSFFYISDLLDMILHGISDRLALFIQRDTWEGMNISPPIEDDDIDREIQKHTDFLVGYNKFRLLLGPIEIVNSATGSKLETKFVNFGDIPISSKYFISWLTEKMIKTEQPRYNLGAFLNDFFNTLLRDFLNNDSCFDGFSVKQKTRLNQAAITSYKTSDQNYDEITEWIKDNGDADMDLMEQPILNISGPGVSGDGGTENEINYLVFFAGRTQPVDKVQGSRSIDEARGVFHYLMGKSTGIVKNISLTRTDAKYLKEVRFEQEGFAGLEQLREVYDANIECYANVKTFPGTYIYVDPRSFAPNPVAYGGSNVDLTMFGIGGYYMIIRSQHDFGPGQANTKLTCKWVAQINPDEACNAATPSSTGDGGVTKCTDKDSNAGVE